MPAAQAAEDDEVVAEYDVYITPKMSEQLYLLQYPNRDRSLPYNAHNGTEPAEMRIKPNAGFIEVDVPIELRTRFDKTKGITWGDALRKAKEEGQNSFGVTAGFDRMPIPRGAQKAAQKATGVTVNDPEAATERLVENFHDSNERGLVYNKHTLGGQILKGEKEKPIYMLGAFRGKELHLTKLTGVVQMRPQFHHVDATTYLEQSNRRREAAEGAKPTEPRSVQMLIKAADGESVDMSSTKNLLTLAKEDAWVKLNYHDEDTPEAFEEYHEKLFVHDTESAQKLTSSLNNEQYLEAISAPRNDPSGRTRKKPLTRKEMRAVDDSDDSDSREKHVRFAKAKENGEVMEIDD